MDSGLVPRRTFLSLLTAAAGVGTAGCLDRFKDTKYTFRTSPAGDSLADLTASFLETDPTEIKAQSAIDYSEEFKRSIVETLLEQGTVDTVQWQLAYDNSFGTTTRPSPRFIERDGTYYSVFETDQTEFTETRWVFYLDLVDDEPSSSDTVVTEPPSSLSETDKLVVRRALEPATGHGKLIDVDDRPLGGRGPTFHSEMDPDASDLIPSAPFDYIEQNDEYLVPRAERGSVEMTRYTFGIEAVATSMAELQEYVESNVVDATFDSDDLDSDVAEILRTATDIGHGRIHTETGSISDGLAELTERLGMAAHIPEEISEYTSLNGTILRFDDEWFRGSLSIRQTL